MTVTSNVTTAEMREAFRLNLTSTLIWKLIRGSARSILYLLVFTALIVTRLVDQHGIDWQKIALIAGEMVVLIVILLFRLNRVAARTAKIVNQAAATFIIDSQGIAEQAPNGTRISVPWSAITRWREGKLVFTLGDEKNFRTISKAALGEVQSGELRSLLLSQVR